MKSATSLMCLILCSLQCSAFFFPYDKSSDGFTELALKLLQDGEKHFQNEPPDRRNVLQEYDFIIVGAGSAGCAIANRLTEFSNWKVLVIEAGRHENYLLDVPILASWIPFSDANWKYYTEPSKNSCLGMQNKRCHYPRGKVVGGSSSINFMINTRGNRADYDNWKNLGNPGWGFDDVLPYFLKIENMTIPELANDTIYHNTHGNLQISYASYRTKLADAFIDSGKELGYATTDYNGAIHTGFSYLQTTTSNGTRMSASKAFLHPIRNRKNLHLIKYSYVSKILIDPVTKNAYGVEYFRNNRKHMVYATKEVIVSAGAINSPQLLMLSGIGPKKHLEKIGIPVIEDLKVGENLMDHPGLAGLTFTVNQSVSLIMDELIDNGYYYNDYLKYRRGPFSVPAGCEAIAFFDSENPRKCNSYPDYEILFFGGSVSSDKAYYKSLGISEHINNVLYKPLQDKHTWQAAVLTLKPKSRGKILLRSKNPFHHPLIYHDIFKDPYDLEIQLKGIKKALEISNTKAFQKYGSKVISTPVPGCENIQFGSDDYWRCFAKHLSIAIWHLSGTCKMGPKSDRGAVVDSRLRVYGVKNLRVIDASIMPMVPSAHTNVPSMMVGARGADLVVEDWNERANYY